MSIEKLAPICALLLTGCVAAPKDDHSNDSQVASAQALKGNKSSKICRREKPLGSNIPRVVCYTRQQLDARTQSLDSALWGETLRSTSSPGPRGDG